MNSEKVMKGAFKLLDSKGYEIVDTNICLPSGNLDLVALDGSTVVFFQISATEDSFEKCIPMGELRSKYEQLAFEFLNRYENFSDCRIRFDSLDFFIMKSGTRALARHNINALG